MVVPEGIIAAINVKRFDGFKPLRFRVSAVSSHENQEQSSNVQTIFTDREALLG